MYCLGVLSFGFSEPKLPIITSYFPRHHHSSKERLLHCDCYCYYISSSLLVLLVCPSATTGFFVSVPAPSLTRTHGVVSYVVDSP